MGPTVSLVKVHGLVYVPTGWAGWLAKGIRSGRGRVLRPVFFFFLFGLFLHGRGWVGVSGGLGLVKELDHTSNFVLLRLLPLLLEECNDLSMQGLLLLLSACLFWGVLLA